ncbi:M28 family peptidase [Novosphingobium sp.]|uniref:M28 family peptidase n=1 Tax=Novosphingobium sp. TaxID=1874826 RepID=UPI0038B76E8E
MALAISVVTPVRAENRADPDGTQWWGYIATLAGDTFEGRDTGSAGHLAAADFVAAEFRKAGAKPAGAGGTYFQAVPLVSEAIDAARSGVRVDVAGASTPLAVGEDIVLSAGVPQPAALTAPLAFIGYGLAIPEAGHDDFADVDLRGKVAVRIYSGPSGISGALLAHSQAYALPKALEKAGAVGLITIIPPHHRDIPWDFVRRNGRHSGMYIDDPAQQDFVGPHLNGLINPAKAAALFAGSGHSLDDIFAAASTQRPIAGFPLNGSITANVAMTTRQLTSPNVVALLPGSGKLKAQYVVISAHLDHVGIGEPVKGDPIHHGAMDNASGVASMLEVANQLPKKADKPRRSILLVAVTGEEKGLLGSRYFAGNPTVPKGSIVADINLDQPLPLFPLKHLLVMGEEQSSLGPIARATALAQGFDTVPDGEPDRMLFVRSDNYSFIRTGVPAIGLTFGHPKGTPEDAKVADWFLTRYHTPQDNLSQPVDKVAASVFNAYLTALVARVASEPVVPHWNSDSFFKRFERPVSPTSSTK